ncbi:MAG: polyketide synthase dehydratase domain-containing protein, partial [bacterium]|nr:polyketide synthase dehydratase domain-containing protein [bacterium]
MFSLEDGMRLAATRGTLLSGIEPGAMAAVFAPAARVAAAVEASNEASAGVGVNISADNGTHQVVSGPVAGIDAVSKLLESEGVRVRRLNTTKAFHSALVEPALDALEAFLDDVTVEAPSLPVVSNLTGRVVEPGDRLDGVYWRRHAREPVAFAAGVGALAELGVDLVVEIGPHSVLAPMAVSAWPESPASAPPRVLASLGRPAGNGTAAASGGFVQAVARAYEAGLPVRFEGLFAGETRRRIPLPGYPFQRQRHWLEAPKRRRGSDGHPLLGVRHESARGEISFETEVFLSDPAWLGDHRVFGWVVAPGALYGAMAATAALAEGAAAVVEDLQLHNPLVFREPGSEDGAEGNGRKVQLVLDPSGQAQAASRGVQLFSKGSDGEWTVHAEARVPSGAPAPQPVTRVDLDSLRAGMSLVEAADYYRARAETGIELGPSFRTIGRLWARPGEALGEVSFPQALGRNGLDVHPLLLDGCFQVVGAARGLAGTQGATTYLPFGCERLWLAGPLPERVVCHVRMHGAFSELEEETGEPPEVLSGELNIYDTDRVLLGVLSGYTVKRATREAMLSAIEGVKDLLYEVVWRDSVLASGLLPADFFPSPATVAAGAQSFSGYLTAANVDPEDRGALLAALERWSRSYALATLDKLGWQRRAGEVVDPEDLRQRLNVNEE